MTGGVFLWASGNDSVYRTYRCVPSPQGTHRHRWDDAPLPEFGQDRTARVLPSLHLLVCLNLQARGPMGGCVMFYSPPTAIFR